MLSMRKANEGGIGRSSIKKPTTSLKDQQILLSGLTCNITPSQVSEFEPYKQLRSTSTLNHMDYFQQDYSNSLKKEFISNMGAQKVRNR